jgi:hypothetical protein
MKVHQGELVYTNTTITQTLLTTIKTFIQEEEVAVKAGAARDQASGLGAGSRYATNEMQKRCKELVRVTI